jgi:hypothetical protein
MPRGARTETTHPPHPCPGGRSQQRYARDRTGNAAHQRRRGTAHRPPARAPGRLAFLGRVDQSSKVARSGMRDDAGGWQRAPQSGATDDYGAASPLPPRAERLDRARFAGEVPARRKASPRAFIEVDAGEGRTAGGPLQALTRGGHAMAQLTDWRIPRPPSAYDVTIVGCPALGPGRNESCPARVCAGELATWESERRADRPRFGGSATASRVPCATTPVVAESRWRFCVRLVTALCIGAAIETLRALDGFSGWCLCTRDTRHGSRPPDSAHCRRVQQGYGAPTMVRRESKYRRRHAVCHPSPHSSKRYPISS